MDDSKAAGKADEAAFWKETFGFVMTSESVAADVKTVIVKDGKIYNQNVRRVERRS